MASSVPAWVICRVMTSAKPQMSLAPGTAASKFNGWVFFSRQAPPHKANHCKGLRKLGQTPSSPHTPNITPNEPR